MSARRNPRGLWRHERLSLGDFYRTGVQDCGNVIDLSEFDVRGGLRAGKTAKQIVADTFAEWEAGGDFEQTWIDQNQDKLQGADDGEDSKLDIRECFQAWRSGWMSCAEKYVEQEMAKRTKDAAEENPMRRRNPNAKTFVVIRINGDRSDTYAVPYEGNVTEAIEDALDLAQPDKKDKIEWWFTDARDAGAARISPPPKPSIHHPVSPERVPPPWIATWRAKQESSPDVFDDAIRAGMASALWVTSYATWVEELPPRERRQIVGSMQGVDWSDVAPEPPTSAESAAAALFDAFEMVNGVSMSELFERALIADKVDEADDELADNFGHCLAMQATGHGVSWFDDHRKFEIKFPRSWEAWTSDGEELEWSPRRNPRR